jgi:excisionase family DNA binding protein
MTTQTPERQTLKQETRDALPLKQAASYLGIQEQTLRIWRHENRGPKSYRIGSRVYFDREDLDAFIAVEKVKTARGGIA